MDIFSRAMVFNVHSFYWQKNGASDFVQPVVPKTKLPASVVAASPRPTILKEDQLLLSLTAPLAKDDLMPANTIKRPEGQISIFSVQPEVRSSWECMIKEGMNIYKIIYYYVLK